MEQEFDKSIDSLMRMEARRGGFVSVTESQHLDVDEIAGFAENALPETARARATGHLADCDRCRTMLSNVIHLNSAEESEIVHSHAEKAVVASQPVPWYQRLFALPKITYAMTGLALLFTAAIAFIAINNNNNSLNSTVAQKDDAYSNAPKGVSGASSEGEGRLAENASTSNAAASNSTANTASNTATVPGSYPASTADEPVPGQPPLNGPSGTPGDITLSKDLVTGSDKDSKVANVPNPTLDGVVAENKRDEATKPAPSEEFRNRANETERSVQKQEQNVGQNQSNIMMPDGARAGKAPPPAPVAATQSREVNDREDERAQKKAGQPAKEKKADDTRTVGGKSFINKGGVWTDTSYPGGGTKTVKRGSDQYKKLDSGLQSIGNSFTGTVIVVWGGKNYKIQ